MNALVLPLLMPLVEEGGGEESVSHLLSYGVGALVLAILVALVLGLLAFGKGREHS